MYQKPEWYTHKPRMYDKTQLAFITKCSLYTHGALFALTINISRCIQKPNELEWCIRKPRMYDKTHKIQIALITTCGLYALGSLFSSFTLFK